jgi:hypothetical protein
VVYTPRVLAQTKILESVQSDPPQQRNQKQKRGEQNGSVEETLKIRIGEKLEEPKMGGELAGPKKPGGKCRAKCDGSDQIGENLQTSAQEEKQLAWTLSRRKSKFFSMHNKHAWVVRTEEGLKREVRVIKAGGSWRFQSKRADETCWRYFDEPPLDDLAEFREVLFRKYQRRRAAYEDVQWADRELARQRDRLK